MAACAGAALKAVIPQPRYKPLKPSFLNTLPNTSMKDRDEDFGFARIGLPTVSAG